MIQDGDQLRDRRLGHCRRACARHGDFALAVAPFDWLQPGPGAEGVYEDGAARCRAARGAAEPAFRTKGLLRIKKRDGVRQAARNRVGRGARVAPLDLIVCDGVGQQIRLRLRLRERLAACVAKGRRFVLVGKVDLVERQNAGCYVACSHRRAALASRSAIVPPDVEIGAAKGSVCPFIMGEPVFPPRSSQIVGRRGGSSSRRQHHRSKIWPCPRDRPAFIGAEDGGVCFAGSLIATTNQRHQAFCFTHPRDLLRGPPCYKRNLCLLRMDARPTANA